MCDQCMINGNSTIYYIWFNVCYTELSSVSVCVWVCLCVCVTYYSSFITLYQLYSLLLLCLWVVSSNHINHHVYSSLHIHQHTHTVSHAFTMHEKGPAYEYYYYHLKKCVIILVLMNLYLMLIDRSLTEFIYFLDNLLQILQLSRSVLI